MFKTHNINAQKDREEKQQIRRERGHFNFELPHSHLNEKEERSEMKPWCLSWKLHWMVRGRLDAEDAKISEPEGAAVETVQNETERKRTPKRKQDHHPDVGETGVPEGRGGRA